MKTFYWLLRREFWEHRGGFLWAPGIAAAVVIIIQILGLVAAAVVGNRNSAHFNGLANASPEQLRKFAGFMDWSVMWLCAIVGLVLFFVLYGYCMKNLSSDRKDRSILFWKSLPISDTATVISKAFSAVLIASIIAFIISAIGSLIMLVIWSVAGSIGGGSFLQLIGASHPGRMMLYIVGAVPVYWVWMLPAVGWLMLCSAFSKGKTVRWAVALPLVIGALFTWVGLTQGADRAVLWGWQHVFGRALVGLLPGSSTFLGSGEGIRFAVAHAHQAHGFAGVSQVLGASVAQKYSMILTPDFLWGALAGLIMLAVAVWLRRWRTEL